MNELRIDQGKRLHAALCALGVSLAVLLTLAAPAAQAQVSVSDGGTPTIARAIAVPPGVAGMAPKLSIMYAGGGVNGPLGYGWSLQGLSLITRCPATEAVDGKDQRAPVAFTGDDKLCLDGQRLIQTDAGGNTGAAVTQTNDALGLSSGAREYRTEKDSFARIRAYGMGVSGDASAGPAYFRVWTKSGQIYEYGASPGLESNAYNGLIINKTTTDLNQDKSVAMVWAISRISDTLGNTIDFRYEKRFKAFGSGGTQDAPLPGLEWNIKEIQYSGNKVIFNYDADSSDVDPRPDKSEAYHQGYKNVSSRRLASITTYTNWPNNDVGPPTPGALPVSTTKLQYDQGLQTLRSRVVKIQECAGGPDSTRCLPATSMVYSEGTQPQLQPLGTFNLLNIKLSDVSGKLGVLVGDFNGDGLSDILRWSENGGDENQLWLSNGDGRFTQGTLDIGDVLMKSNGCYYTVVVDANSDGYADLLRIPSTKASDGVTECNVPMQAEYYINRGNGNFVRKTLATAGDSGSPIVFDRVRSKLVQKAYCALPAVPSGPTPDPTRTIPDCRPRYGIGWTAGATFFLIDVDGDGFVDLVTGTLAAKDPQDPLEGLRDPELGTAYVPCNRCTHVYLSTNGEGQFREVDSVLNNYVVYADPGDGADLQSLRRAIDLNGDGIADLSGVGTPYRKGAWTSEGRAGMAAGLGDFTRFSSDWNCDKPIDFNGDGRSDCLQTAAGVSSNMLWVAGTQYAFREVPRFNLTDAGEELSSDYQLPVGQNYGTAILDVDGDGRQDIVRWHDDPTKNLYFRSLGDGTFADSGTAQGASLVGVFAGVQLKHSSGKFDFVVGDFTGHGVLEMLRVSQDAPTDASKPNQLLQVTLPTRQGEPASPDLLTSVTAGTGATTILKYVSLSNSAVSTDKRYKSDRTPANPASGPVQPPADVDLIMPAWVVATLQSDTGLGSPGSTLVNTEFSYAGLKANLKGRGMLGFREVRRQVQAPNGSPLTVVTQYLQSHPYIGVASMTQTLLGAYTDPSLPLSGDQVISQVSNIYCDKTSGTAAGSASTSAPCATAALVQKPYLYRSTETGFDVKADNTRGVALPTVVTTNTYNDWGDPLTIGVLTTGTSVGVAQSTTKTTTNFYDTPLTTCNENSCSWVLGRLTSAKVETSVDDLIDQLTTSKGTGAYADKTVGTGPLTTGGWNVIVFDNTASALTAAQGGAPATGTVTFKNTGTKDANLQFSGLSAPFSVMPTSCTAAANGGTCVVTITMATNGTVGTQGPQTLTAQCCGATAATATVNGTLTGGSLLSASIDFENVGTLATQYKDTAHGCTTISSLGGISTDPGTPPGHSNANNNSLINTCTAVSCLNDGVTINVGSGVISDGTAATAISFDMAVDSVTLEIQLQANDGSWITIAQIPNPPTVSGWLSQRFSYTPSAGTYKGLRFFAAPGTWAIDNLSFKTNSANCQ